MPPLPLPKMIPFYALEDSPIWTCLRQPGLLIDHGELRTTLSLDFGLTALLRARQMVFGRGPRRQLQMVFGRGPRRQLRSRASGNGLNAVPGQWQAKSTK